MIEDTTGPENDPNAEPDIDFSSMFGQRDHAFDTAGRDARGVAELMEQAVAFAGDYARPVPTEVRDPETGAIVLGMLHRDGFKPLPHELFDEASGAPRIRKGTAVMTSLASFIAHVNRFGDEDSAVFACDSRTAPSVTAILDYHRRDTLKTEGEDETVGDRIHGEYRFGRHQTHYAFPLSDEWNTWGKFDGVRMSMAEFATFLEDNMDDIDRPDTVPENLTRFVSTLGGEAMIADYGRLMELSRGLKVNENSNIEEAINLASGEGAIRFVSDHVTNVKVPTMFFIAIPVFKTGAFYRVAAKLRYRKSGSTLTFWYELYRADKAFDHAFSEAMDKITRDTEAPVFLGKPEA